jgi:ribonuclease P protein component
VKKNQTFPKEEKLKSRKMISKIFSEGSAVKTFPLRIQFIFHDLQHLPPCQMGVSVPKRHFKKAVDRNRIKRQIKEAYRLNKSNLIDDLTIKNKRLAMMIIFLAKDKLDYEQIEQLLNSSLGKLRI